MSRTHGLALFRTLVNGHSSPCSMASNFIILNRASLILLLPYAFMKSVGFPKNVLEFFFQPFV